MKITKGNVATIATWAGLSLLVIAANLSAPPPGWLTLPAWLILSVGVGIRFSSAPNDSPYKQASAITLIALVVMVDSLFSPIDRSPVFLLVREPSLAHLILPRPFHALVIVYLSSLCVLLNIKVQRLQSAMVDQKQRYTDLQGYFSEKRG